ncbi:MAG: hypothetical protein IJX63_00630 [Lachnospiraceae bacterium]|nr:hypothetical protein [Lachnospiraceae bacterium]
MRKAGKVILVLLCVLLICVLGGCGYQEMQGSQVTDYLSDRYGGTFEIVSAEEKARCDRDNLDVDMEKLNTKSNDTNEDKDYIYTIKDENDVEFHLVGFKHYGWGSYYQYTDDYNMQVLKTKAVLYEKLNSLGFPYSYYNEIGYKEIPKTFFSVEISCFEEVAGVVTDLFEMVTCEELEIPWVEYSNEELSVLSIIPSVRLVSQDICVWNATFRHASQEDVVDVKTHIQNAEREYVYSVREGKINETLSEDILLTYGPEKITDVYFGEEKVPIYLYYGVSPLLGTEWDCYIVWDNPEKIEEKGPRVYYDDLCMLLEAVGYGTDYTKNAVHWTKDGNTVTIEVNEDNYICKHNGEVYETEGIINAALIKLTEQDMQELFGLTYEIDKIKEQVQIVEKK